MDIPNSKAAIRNRIRACLKLVTEDERLQASEQACKLLETQEVWKNARSVLFYVPLKDELDLSRLWESALLDQKVLALPRFAPELEGYVACHLKDRTELTSSGRFGILEPSGICPVYPLKQLDLVLVPGVAFDKNGRRLGRGKGFYDRLLKDVSGTKCGVAFDQQIERDLPVEPHDVHLNCILTPARWFSVDQTSALK